MGNGMEISYKNLENLSWESAVYLLGIYLQTKNTDPELYVHILVNCSAVHNGQNQETIQVSNNWWVGKKVVLHILGNTIQLPFYHKMDGIGEECANWIRPEAEGQILDGLAHTLDVGDKAREHTVKHRCLVQVCGSEGWVDSTFWNRASGTLVVTKHLFRRRSEITALPPR